MTGHDYKNWGRSNALKPFDLQTNLQHGDFRSNAEDWAAQMVPGGMKLTWTEQAGEITLLLRATGFCAILEEMVLPRCKSFYLKHQHDAAAFWVAVILLIEGYFEQPDLPGQLCEMWPLYQKDARANVGHWDFSSLKPPTRTRNNNNGRFNMIQDPQDTGNRSGGQLHTLTTQYSKEAMAPCQYHYDLLEKKARDKGERFDPETLKLMHLNGGCIAIGNKTPGASEFLVGGREAVEKRQSITDSTERSAVWETHRAQVDEATTQLRQAGLVNVGMESMIQEIAGSVGLSEGGKIHTFEDSEGSPCL